MKIAIVGSRDFPQLKLVEQFIRDLPRGVTIVSGGAKGVDSAAKEYAEDYCLEYLEFLPDLSGCKERFEFTKRYYDRNQLIVDASDLIVAFTEKENGGTWDTIRKARKANKPVKIIRPFLLFPGAEEHEDEPLKNEDQRDSKKLVIAEGDQENDDPEPEQRDKRKTIGKGPFHMKRITLGSFALNLKRYADPLDLADLLNAKEDDVELFARLVTPSFINFFETYPPGIVHAITQAPKSVRNSHKAHCMDIVCRNVAEHLGCEFVELFENWEKPGRGTRKWEGEIVVKEEIKKYIGKVVFVLDDFMTTGNTMQKSCKALTSLEIHNHGLCYMFWS